MAKYSEQTWLLFAVSGVALCVECEQKLPCVHKPIVAILTLLCDERCRNWCASSYRGRLNVYLESPNVHSSAL